jgi:hypothetical protein
VGENWGIGIAELTAGRVIGGALVLHAVFIALLVRRALRLPRPDAPRERVSAWVWVPTVVGAVLWAVTVSIDAADAVVLLSFTWILWLLLWLGLPWLHARMGPDAPVGRAWPLVVGLLALGVVVLAAIAGDALAQQVL